VFYDHRRIQTIRDSHFQPWFSRRATRIGGRCLINEINNGESYETKPFYWNRKLSTRSDGKCANAVQSSAQK